MASHGFFIIISNAAEVRKDLSSILDRLGRRAKVFPSRKEAFAWLEDNEGDDGLLDGVFCDASIAGMSAKDLVASLRDNPSIKRLPVILIVKEAAPGKAPRMDLPAGADMVINRHFNIHEIEAGLKNLCG